MEIERISIQTALSWVSPAVIILTILMLCLCEWLPAIKDGWSVETRILVPSVPFLVSSAVVVVLGLLVRAGAVILVD